MSAPAKTSDQSLLQRIQGRRSAACEGRLPPGALSMLSAPPILFLLSGKKRTRRARCKRKNALPRSGAAALRADGVSRIGARETRSAPAGSRRTVRFLLPCPRVFGTAVIGAEIWMDSASESAAAGGSVPGCFDLADAAARRNGRSRAVPVFENLQNPLIQNREP